MTRAGFPVAASRKTCVVTTVAASARLSAALAPSRMRTPTRITRSAADAMRSTTLADARMSPPNESAAA